MAYTQKDNSGALFKNDKKETDKHPDYTGTVVINGVDMWVSAWVNTAETGRKYMSLNFQKKESPAQRPAKQPARGRDEDDDIPF